ncbi:unnamed protein product [Blepharisma stoltei]|uniref:Calmodulin n=1 Tax=Blepharisma stoltei TaxID=1481888 RepID=A0AAU9J047_9CILI|nr:unnamed protein product [Blepharisma stoltei]
MDEALSPEQILAFKKAFKLFDDNGDDLIPLSELGTVMRALGQNPTDEELDEYGKEFDPDNNGLIYYEGFQALMIRRLKKDDREEEMLEAFRAFDREGTGKVKCEDIRESFLALCKDLTEDELEEMLKEMDPEGFGEIDYISAVKKMITSQTAPPKKAKKGKKKKK